MPQHENPSILLQPRDVDVFKTLFECRVATIAHLSLLHFDGHREAAKKRIAKLQACGYLSQRPRHPFEPAVIHLAPKALSFLHSEGELREFPSLSHVELRRRSQVSALTIKHELRVMDVRCALQGAIKASDSVTLDAFTTWPRLCQFTLPHSSISTPFIVRPDGFFRATESPGTDHPISHSCFLEVDRSTESLDTIVRRAHHYQTYYRCGGFATRNGDAATNYKQYPFRLLIVLNSRVRRDNLARRLLEHHPPILNQAYLATIEDVLKKPLDHIWIRPSDFRASSADVQLRPKTTNLSRDAWRYSEDRTIVSLKPLFSGALQKVPDSEDGKLIEHHEHDGASKD